MVFLHHHFMPLHPTGCNVELFESFIDLIQHLYIHIPFCHKVCPYCSFYKHTPGGTDHAAFVQAVLTELRLLQRQHEIQPKTIFFGGGTPTALSERHLTTLLEGMREQLGFDTLEEFCLEANPKTVSLKKANLLKQQGVTRISLGVQAWDMPTLKLLGRDHEPDEAVETFHILREAGIPSLNIDLMFSIPGQNVATWCAGLEKTIALQSDHVSCYNLTYEEDTEFLLKLQTGELDMDEDRDADHFLATIRMLEGAGFDHYEISNYAKPGHRSRHNHAYWRGADYLGLGPSASSTCQRVRWKNISDTNRYIQLLQEGRLPIVESEDLNDRQWLMERVALEIRTDVGLARERIDVSVNHHLDTLLQEGFIELNNEHFRLTTQGKAVADTIAEMLLPD